MLTFEQYLIEAGHMAKTVSAYSADVALFGEWFAQTNGQALTPAGFTSIDVREYRGWLAARAAPATVNRRLAALRAYGAYLMATGQATINAAAAARGMAQQKLAPRWLDKRQQSALLRELELKLNAARTDPARREATRNRTIVLLLLHTGLRVAELCALDLADLTINERSGRLVVRAGKGDKHRELPLNLAARLALNDWLASRGGEGAALLIGKGAHRLRPRAVQRMLAEAGRRAGVEVTPHVLRHTFAHNLTAADVPLDQVAPLLGHNSMNTTARYAMPGRAELTAAVEVLDD